MMEPDLRERILAINHMRNQLVTRLDTPDAKDIGTEFFLELLEIGQHHARIAWQAASYRLDNGETP